MRVKPAAAVLCGLALWLPSSPPLQARCADCGKNYVDGDLRFTCVTSTSGASECLLAGDKKSCSITADCCGCGGGKGPILVMNRKDLLREVGVFLGAEARTAPPAGEAFPPGTRAPAAGGRVTPPR